MRLAAAAVFIMCAAGSPVRAQDTARPPAGSGPVARDSLVIPRQHMPPKGMCRIWITGVPAAQQPAPTDCQAAVKNKPRNGTVIYGEGAAEAKAAPPVPNFRNVGRPARPRSQSSQRP